MYQKLSVGERIMSPGPECVKFDLYEGGYLLLLCYNKPTAKEKADIKNGAYQFRAIAQDGVVFFLARFGVQPWVDAPFHRGLAQTDTIVIPPEGMGTALHVMLVDCSTGVLQAQKLIGLRHDFSLKLIELIESQSEEVPSDWNQLIKKVYARYSSDQLANLAGIRE